LKINRKEQPSLAITDLGYSPSLSVAIRFIHNKQVVENGFTNFLP